MRTLSRWISTELKIESPGGLLKFDTLVCEEGRQFNINQIAGSEYLAEIFISNNVQIDNLCVKN